MFITRTGSAEHGGCTGTGAVAGGYQGPLAPASPGVPGPGCHRVPWAGRSRHRAAACRAGGERAADVGPSFISIKKHVFGVYRGKTNNLY